MVTKFLLWTAIIFTLAFPVAATAEVDDAATEKRFDQLIKQARQESNSQRDEVYKPVDQSYNVEPSAFEMDDQLRMIDSEQSDRVQPKVSPIDNDMQIDELDSQFDSKS